MPPDPPVGVCCPHRNITPTPMQHPSYRKDDGDGWIYYHGYYLHKPDRYMQMAWCGKPEEWRWRQYLRRCGECNTKFSNPWVPVCEDCWTDSTSYPGWDYVIRLDRERKHT